MDDSERIRLYENTINEIKKLEKEGKKSFCLMCDEGFSFETKTTRRCKECKRRTVWSINKAMQFYLKNLYEIFQKRGKKPYRYRIVTTNGRFVLIGSIEPQYMPEKPCSECGEALVETISGDKCINKDCPNCRENENFWNGE